LRKWELEVPLCKLSGDYPLAEADYYIAAQHYARALAGLRIYRKGVDVSSSLPEAMGLEMDCLAQMKKEADARELAKDIVKRFPNHPIGERARKVLANGL
jgi:TolA-binding protein